MTDIRVNRILGVERSTAAATALILTDRSGTLTAAGPDLVAELAQHAGRGLPVSLAIDPDERRIEQVSTAPRDPIMRLTADWDGSGDVMVFLMRRPSPLFLRRTNPRFDALRALLESASAEGRVVALGTRPAGRDIHDVRVQDWE